MANSPAVAALSSGPLLAAREDCTKLEHGGLHNANIAQNGYNRTDNDIVLYNINNQLDSWDEGRKNATMKI